MNDTLNAATEAVWYERTTVVRGGLVLPETCWRDVDGNEQVSIDYATLAELEAHLSFQPHNETVRERAALAELVRRANGNMSKRVFDQGTA
jgi:hypothetical protein